MELVRELVREASREAAFRETVLPLSKIWRRRSGMVKERDERLRRVSFEKLRERDGSLTEGLSLELESGESEKVREDVRWRIYPIGMEL